MATERQATTELQKAVNKFGVRGVARQLGVTPAYVSMLARGKRRLTDGISTAVTELVNSQGVNKRGQRGGLGGRRVADDGAGEGIRTLDFLLGKQTLCR